LTIKVQPRSWATTREVTELEIAFSLLQVRAFTDWSTGVVPVDELIERAGWVTEEFSFLGALYERCIAIRFAGRVPVEIWVSRANMVAPNDIISEVRKKR
jgi:hypothetical protein